MSRAIEYQAFLIGLSLMTGIWLMMAYDTLRLLRLMIRHHNDGISMGRHLNGAEADSVGDKIAAVFMLDHRPLHPAAHPVILIGDRIFAR